MAISLDNVPQAYPNLEVQVEQLKVVREERGLSRAGVAALSGLNPATITRIEKGERSPTVETLEKLAVALDVELADFFPKAQAPLPLEFRVAVGLEEPSEASPIEASFLDAWTEYIRERARSWEARLDEIGERLSEDFPKAALWCEEVEDEARAIFAADRHINLWEIKGQQHLEARWEVRSTAKRVSEAVWSAIEQAYSGPRRGTPTGVTMKAAEEAARNRAEFTKQLDALEQSLPA